MDKDYVLVADGATLTATPDGEAPFTVQNNNSFTTASTCDLLLYDHNGSSEAPSTSNNPSMAQMKMYYFRVYDSSGNLRLDLVPVKKGNEVGMYDRVGKQFYATATTVPFTAGPELSSFLGQLVLDPRRVDADPNASGGDIILKEDNDYIHIFTTPGDSTFTVNQSVNATVLLVGGGGGGGNNVGGGGGGGGVTEVSSQSMPAGSYTVTVGAGGAAATASDQWGVTGGTSSIADLGGASAPGGTGGIGWNASKATPPGTAGQAGSAGNAKGGNGGKAGGSNSSGDAGSPGSSSLILGWEQVFGGGGGGGANIRGDGSSGGAGGGGNGAGTKDDIVISYATGGEDGLGGGGGGSEGGHTGTIGAAGAGGSGIVIIRVTAGSAIPSVSTLTVTLSGSSATYTGGSVEPNITVKDGGTTLFSGVKASDITGKGFTAQWMKGGSAESVQNAGSYTLVLKGDGAIYTGTAEKGTFTVEKKTVTPRTPVVSDYTGTSLTCPFLDDATGTSIWNPNKYEQSNAQHGDQPQDRGKTFDVTYTIKDTTNLTFPGDKTTFTVKWTITDVKCTCSTYSSWTAGENNILLGKVPTVEGCGVGNENTAGKDDWRVGAAVLTDGANPIQPTNAQRTELKGSGTTTFTWDLGGQATVSELSVFVGIDSMTWGHANINITKLEYYDMTAGWKELKFTQSMPYYSSNQKNVKAVITRTNGNLFENATQLRITMSAPVPVGGSGNYYSSLTEIEAIGEVHASPIPEANLPRLEPQRTFKYDNTEKTVSLSDDTYVQIVSGDGTGVAAATAAGVYYVWVQPKAGYVWPDDESSAPRKYEWGIVPSNYTEPFGADRNFLKTLENSPYRVAATALPPGISGGDIILRFPNEENGVAVSHDFVHIYTNTAASGFVFENNSGSPRPGRALIVGGGGASGYTQAAGGTRTGHITGGGGGGGAVRSLRDLMFDGAYSIKVGKGGVPADSKGRGNSGESSSFGSGSHSWIVLGGGGGGKSSSSGSDANSNGLSAGTGGGAGGKSGSAGAGGADGYAGGVPAGYTTTNWSDNFLGAGGGGAGRWGESGKATEQSGGYGFFTDILSSPGVIGEYVCFGGGGAGGGTGESGHSKTLGGFGGGGNSYLKKATETSFSDQNNETGVNGLGGGGSAASTDSFLARNGADVAKNGGDGIVIVRYTDTVQTPKIKKVQIPTIENTYVFNYARHDVLLTSGEKLVDTEDYTVSGDFGGVYIQEYTVTLTLRNPDNMQWNNGQTQPQKLPWSIVHDQFDEDRSFFKVLATNHNRIATAPLGSTADLAFRTERVHDSTRYYRYELVYKDSQSVTFNTAVNNAEVLLVGGGGAGGSTAGAHGGGGGGGGGGVRFAEGVSFAAGQSYALTVGTGGQTAGSKGGDSTINTVAGELTAGGGGGGATGGQSAANMSGASGGSGGGGGGMGSGGSGGDLGRAGGNGIDPNSQHTDGLGGGGGGGASTSGHFGRWSEEHAYNQSGYGGAGSVVEILTGYETQAFGGGGAGGWGPAASTATVWGGAGGGGNAWARDNIGKLNEVGVDGLGGGGAGGSDGSSKGNGIGRAGGDGIIVIAFEIEAGALIDKPMLTTDRFTYSGNEVLVTDYLTSFAHMTATGTDHATNVGAYQFAVAPASGYVWSDTDGTEPVSFDWSIGAKPIQGNITVDAIPNQTYDGSAKTPSLTVRDPDRGVELVLGVDYTAEYFGNVNIGTATIKLTGIGNYTATENTTFQIVANPNEQGYYVTPDADGSGDGSGWETPTTLASALTKAQSATKPVAIYMMEGTYAISSACSLSSPGQDVKIMGGYTGTGLARSQNFSVLDGGGSSGFLLLDSTHAIALQQLELKNSTAAVTKAGTGALTVEHCLFDNNKTAAALQVSAGSATVGNSTFAKNAAGSVNRTGGTVTVKNSILWNTSSSSEVSGTVTLQYVLLPGSATGTGVIHSDPKFVDAANGDFHLMSTAGHYTSGGWEPDLVSSPAIDAGDPNADCSAEPKNSKEQNFGLNLGVYGNTAQASKSPVRATVTVTFSKGGGSGGTESVKGLEGTAMPAVSVPMRENYNFLGYFTATAGGGTKYYDENGQPFGTPVFSTGVDTLYAKWEAATVTVTLNANGGSDGATTSVTATNGQPMPTIAVANLPTRTGYTFAGFFENNDGTGKQYYNANGTSANNYDKTAASTIYAHWTANTYTITLNPNGGTISDDAKTITATYDAVLPNATPATPPDGATDVTFTGYYDIDDVQWYNADGTPVSSKSPYTRTADLTLYAHWNATAYYKVGSDSDANSSSFAKSGNPGGGSGWALTEGGTPIVHTVMSGCNYYLPSGAYLRTPTEASTFAGDSLTVSSTFILSPNAEVSAKIIADGGTVTATWHNPNNCTLNGTITAESGKRLNLYAYRTEKLQANCALNVGSTITGSGNLGILLGAQADATTSQLKLSGDMSRFTGNLVGMTVAENPTGYGKYILTISGSFGGGIASLPHDDANSKGSKIIVNYDGLTGARTTGLPISSTTIPARVKDSVTFFGSSGFDTPFFPLMTFPAGTTVNLADFTVYHSTAVDGTKTPFTNLGKIVNGDGSITLVANVQMIAKPTAVTGLVYNGNVQTGVAEGAGYTLTGDTGTDATSYTATATLKSGYVWEDGTTAAASVPWSIAKATNAWTTEPKLSATSYPANRPAVLTWGVATFGTATATLNGAQFAQGDALPVTHGEHRLVFTVAGTSNYTELSETIDFTVTEALYDLHAISATGPVIKDVPSSWLTAAFPTAGDYQAAFISTNVNGVTGWAAYILGFSGDADSWAIIEKTTQSTMSDNKVALTIALPDLPTTTRAESAGCTLAYSLLTSDNAETLRKGGGDVVDGCLKISSSSFTVPLSIPTDANHVYYRIRIHFIFAGGGGEVVLLPEINEVTFGADNWIGAPTTKESYVIVDLPADFDGGWIEVKYDCTRGDVFGYQYLAPLNSDGNPVLSVVRELGKTADNYYSFVDGMFPPKDVSHFYDHAYYIPPWLGAKKLRLKFSVSDFSPEVDLSTTIVKNLSITEISEARALQIADADYAVIQNDFEHAKSDEPLRNVISGGLNTKKLAAALKHTARSDQPYKLMLLGDSIMWDANNGELLALMHREFPDVEISPFWINNGNPGDFMYFLNNSVAEGDYDGVLFTGISLVRQKVALTSHPYEDIINEFLTRIKNLGMECIIAHPLLSCDSRNTDLHSENYWYQSWARAKVGAEWTPVPYDSQTYDWYFDGMIYGGRTGVLNGGSSSGNHIKTDTDAYKFLVQLEGVDIWCLDPFIRTFLHEGSTPIEFYNRDALHNNQYGKQFNARLLIESLKTLRDVSN